MIVCYNEGRWNMQWCCGLAASDTTEVRTTDKERAVPTGAALFLCKIHILIC